jgi:O-antigen/teichoic acid export membrane protein
VKAALLRFAPLLRVVAGQGVASLTSFATVLALGRWGGESGLGIYALGWSCWFLAMSLGDTLIATPCTYFQAQKARLADDLTMAAAWGVGLLCAAFWLGLTALWWWDLAGVAALWPALPAAVAAASVREFVRRQLLSAGKVARLLRLDTSGSLLQLAGIAGLAALDRLTPANAFWAIAAAALLSVLPLLSAARLRRLWAARRQAPRVLAAFFGYGRWLLLGGMCHVMGVQAYPWLAFAAGGERLAGLYAACGALLNVLAPLLTGLTNYFRPRFMAAHVRLAGPEFMAYVLRRAALFVAPGIALWIVLALGGETLLARIYGPGFREGAAALAWLGLGMVAVSLAAPLQLALLALREPVTNLYYHGSALLWLALGAFAVSGRPSLAALGQIYGAVNLASVAMLALLFFTRQALRHRPV